MRAVLEVGRDTGTKARGMGTKIRYMGTKASGMGAKARGMGAKARGCAAGVVPNHRGPMGYFYLASLMEYIRSISLQKKHISLASAM